MTRRMPVRLPGRADPSTAIQRVVVGAVGHPQARDAALLAETIARATGATLTLVVVRPPEPPGVLPQIGESAAKLEARLHALQAHMAAGASTTVEGAHSVASGLARVVAREHADLLVLGSSRHAPEGRVRIGKRTRQLLADADCLLAVAPRGLCSRGRLRLTVIGVGYEGTAESREALSKAGSLARTTGARLRVRAVVDDRLPYVGWTPTSGRDLYEIWDAVVEPDVESLREDAERAASATGADVVVEAGPGSPPDELIELSREVDLLVIGSGRWGAAARVLLGTTGEELMHQACCSVMVVPRPASSPRMRHGAM